MSTRCEKQRGCVVIPARFASSRFPGKPLTPLLGRPMILWVAELSALAVGKEHVFVATDDDRISKVVTEAGFNALMTSAQALTGTDRVAEAARSLDYDIFINVQGDEPLLDPEDIVSCLTAKSKYPNRIINGFCRVGAGEDPNSPHIPKVITNEKGSLVYISRAPLPAYKDEKNAPKSYKKQVCIYGFSREDLEAYYSYGRKSELERVEDIEILRFLELGREVFMFECEDGSLAVDVPSDVQNVERVLRDRSV